MIFKNEYLNTLLNKANFIYENDKAFLNSFTNFLIEVEDIFNDKDNQLDYKVLESLLEPENIIEFDVPWIDDNGLKHINKGYRVQYSSLLGPYKGGTRFHPSVDLKILKQLAFLQTIKNALTGLPLGGAKGGADFDPKNKSETEIKRFCEAYIDKLHPYIGPDLDIPGGDLGIGTKEIGYMYNHYKKIKKDEPSVFTSKDISLGGIPGRVEATGYGLCFYVNEMLKSNNDSFKNKRIIISGCGNVGINANKKSTELGAKVIAMSNSQGYIYDEDGVDLNIIIELYKNHLPLHKYIDLKPKAKYHDNPKTMFRDVKAEIALPCAKENEIDETIALAMVANGIKLVAEGANLPCTYKAIKIFKENNIKFAPGKQSNAGGVAISFLEMVQNKQNSTSTFDNTMEFLQNTMQNIYTNHKENLKKLILPK